MSTRSPDPVAPLDAPAQSGRAGLPDFRRLEALVAVRCRVCGAKRTVDPVPMLSALVGRAAPLVWSELARELPCTCGSIDVRLGLLPFAARGAWKNPTARAAAEPVRQELVTLALGALDHGAYRWRTETAATIDVRLALVVLATILADKASLRCFWQEALIPADPLNKPCHNPVRDAYHGVAAALRAEGWAAPI